MIKNPQIGQIVFFFEGLRITKGAVSHNWEETRAVEINRYLYRKNRDIYPSKQSAQKNQKHEISKALKSLNQEIKKLSKKRENLASKLAKLIS